MEEQTLIVKREYNGASSNNSKIIKSSLIRRADRDSLVDVDSISLGDMSVLS